MKTVGRRDEVTRYESTAMTRVETRSNEHVELDSEVADETGSRYEDLIDRASRPIVAVTGG